MTKRSGTSAEEVEVKVEVEAKDGEDIHRFRRLHRLCQDGEDRRWTPMHADGGGWVKAKAADGQNQGL